MNRNYAVNYAAVSGVSNNLGYWQARIIIDIEICYQYLLLFRKKIATILTEVFEYFYFLSSLLLL